MKWRPVAFAIIGLLVLFLIAIGLSELSAHNFSHSALAFLTASYMAHLLTHELRGK